MSTSLSKKWDVFISCAAEDTAVAEHFREQLNESGWSTFLFSVDLNLNVGTKRWSELIDELLGQCAVMIVIVTSHALASKWVKYEYRTAHERILSGREGLIIPVFVDGPSPDDEAIPFALKAYQGVDYRSPQHRGAAFDAVSRLIRGFEHEAKRSPANSTTTNSTLQPKTSPPRHAARGVRLLWLLIGALPLLLVPASPDRRRQPSAEEVFVDSFAVSHDRAWLALSDDALWRDAASALEAQANLDGAAARVRAAASVAAALAHRSERGAEEVVRAVERSGQLDPTWIVPHLVQSALLASIDSPRALAAARRAIALAPNVAAGFGVRGTASLLQGDVHAARQDLRKATEFAPASAYWLGALSLALGTGADANPVVATATAKDALALNPRVATAHLLLAHIALASLSSTQLAPIEREERTRSALAHAEKANALNWRDPRAKIVLGDAYDALGQAEAAKEAFYKASELGKAAPNEEYFARQLLQVGKVVSVKGERDEPTVEAPQVAIVVREDAPRPPRRPPPNAPRSEPASPSAIGNQQVAPERTEAGGLILR